MAVLPAFGEYFSNIPDYALPQATAPRLGSGALSAYQSSPGAHLSKSSSTQSLFAKDRRQSILASTTNDLYAPSFHPYSLDGLQSYHKQEESPATSERGDCNSYKVSTICSTNQSLASDNSESPAFSFQDLRTSTHHGDDAEDAYNYACMNWDRSNVTSSSSPSGNDGWFDTNSPVVQTALRSVSKLSRNELFDDFWRVDSSRRHYGSQPAKKKKHSSSAMPTHHRNSRDKQHKFKELFRRSRHRIYQRDLHLLTCERANLLAQEDKLYDLYRPCDDDTMASSGKTKKTSAPKNPSKDDQLMTNIYMQILSAIVVRSEHEGRMQAEKRVQELEKKLRRYEKSDKGEHNDTYANYSTICC